MNYLAKKISIFVFTLLLPVHSYSHKESNNDRFVAASAGLGIIGIGACCYIIHTLDQRKKRRCEQDRDKWVSSLIKREQKKCQNIVTRIFDAKNDHDVRGCKNDLYSIENPLKGFPVLQKRPQAPLLLKNLKKDKDFAQACIKLIETRNIPTIEEVIQKSNESLTKSREFSRGEQCLIARTQIGSWIEAIRYYMETDATEFEKERLETLLKDAWRIHDAILVPHEKIMSYCLVLDPLSQ